MQKLIYHKILTLDNVASPLGSSGARSPKEYFQSKNAFINFYSYLLLSEVLLSDCLLSFISSIKKSNMNKNE